MGFARRTIVPVYSGRAALTITTRSLAAATEGNSYSVTLERAQGTAPFSWSVSSGSLPSGLSLNTNTGEISGTPDTVIGERTFDFTVTIEDNGSPQESFSRELSLHVNGALASLLYNSVALLYSGQAIKYLPAA